MKCPKCGNEEIKAFITVQLYIDANDNNHLTKKVISKKSTEIWSQSHDRTVFTCTNPNCCYSWGYGYHQT